MPRTTTEIVREIEEKAQGIPALQALQSANSISLWSALKNLFAFLAQFLEQCFAKHKAEVEQSLQERQVGTKKWYEQKVLAYQHGELYHIIDGKVAYQEPKPEKQIVHLVSISESESAGLLNLKVVKKEAKPLNSEEIAGLASYIRKVKLIGTKIKIISLPAEKILLNITLEVSPEVFNADGNTIIDGKPIVKDKIKKYLQELAFGETFYLSQLVDFVQKIPGVKDVHISLAKNAKAQNIERKYSPLSGHLCLDEQSQITYVFN